jgi:hypothetical protein
MRRYIRTLSVAVFFLLSVGINTSFAQDPGAPGSLAVTREEYNFGDTAFTPTNFPGPVELHASIHYPTSLAGPYPVILFLHGRHITCLSGSQAQFLEWPCTKGRIPIPSYKGYDYVSEVLASHGYAVVSISANGISAVDNLMRDLGTLARAELIQKHLDILNTFNTTGGAPFGNKFVGKFDLSRVGTMGQSRGGEGVVRQYNLNNSLGAPYGIKAVFLLAPSDFHRFVVNNVALNVLLPYCDGDAADLQGVHYYDDARYNVPGDQTPKHYELVMGANHNYYNTIWSPSSTVTAQERDDWSFIVGAPSDSHCGNRLGNKRLTEAQQRGTGLAYMTAFFRAYVGGESQFIPILTGDAPPPPSAQTNNLFVSYHAPANRRLDVNRLLNDTNLSINTLGAAVTQIGLTPYELCGGEAPQPQKCLPDALFAQQPHVTIPFLGAPFRGLSQLKTGWNNFNGNYRNDIPPSLGDVSRFQALQFRVGVNFADVRNVPNLSQDFRVVLTDASGSSASVRVSDFSSALFYPPGEVQAVPRTVLNTVRLPLSVFSGVNLTAVTSVQFTFNERLQGGILISDVAFASAP